MLPSSQRTRRLSEDWIEIEDFTEFPRSFFATSLPRCGGYFRLSVYQPLLNQSGNFCLFYSNLKAIFFSQGLSNAPRLLKKRKDFLLNFLLEICLSNHLLHRSISSHRCLLMEPRELLCFYFLEGLRSMAIETLSDHYEEGSEVSI